MILKSMWGWKEILYLFMFVFIIVPVTVESLFYDYALQVIGNALYAGVLMGFIMAVIFTTVVYLFCIKRYKLSWKDIGIRKLSWRNFLWTVVALIFLIIVSIAILMMMEKMGISFENSKTETIQNDKSIYAFCIAVIGAAVISPIYEEILYRGVFYTFFRDRYGIWGGVLISSIIFTVVHIPTYNTLPVNFLGGVVFAWLYEKTNSILSAMIAHALSNFIAVLLTFMSN
ncbi:type II CAAX endopeptidase family protein [Bacillus mobilis]|uniref:CAAX protease family protein n=2 Tax=Bacillus cereus group TaxID=86661 RepID=A0A1C3ZUK3_BACCE|nr:MULTISPECIES: type II CAAX endopeptidase family protein [Bacillus cereus group]MCC2460866.1 CPBP family intramembrane metalloprotease [Bacillus mobilis]MCU5434048.1 CPBP family intramembrane metalloprotease [Bacillus mobilis]MCU5592162.1 CPBP family intramembrane metalloprotease [Bacillus mobilis]MCU5737026.1 CPBP family intramembrane metalloprotease [Bacillus mobilis]MCU9560789.1 CPBP family intramembrane metalloprotease [Bacillus mobilis]